MDVAGRFEAFGIGELRTTADAFRAVVSHRELILKVARRNELVDGALGELLSDRCLEMLKRDGESADPMRRRVAVAAAVYFTTLDDAEPDVESVIGFDDDIQVINAALDYLGYRELMIKPS